jgi:membrane-associated phospholipid phosphatase
MQRLASIISAVFHPMIMPLAAVFVAANFDWYVKGVSPPGQMRLVFLIIFLSTVAFPGINILLLRWYGVVTSLEMPRRRERAAPYISSAFFFGLGYYLLRKANLPDVIYSILFGCFIALITITLINFAWKISAHATGVFGLVGTTAGLFQVHSFENVFLFSVLVLIGALVMTSRLVLKAHTPPQVYAGAVVGFLCLYIPVSRGWFI